MRSKIRLYCFLIICVLALAAATNAQTTSGSITGNVTDPQLSAVTGATVSVTDEARSLTLTATTDKEGRFVFPQVPPGSYKLTVEAAGFKKMERTGLLLVANDKLALGDLALEVGQANETVTVTAEATLVQAESAERSYAVQGEIVRNIAVNGRGITALTSIVPGLVSTTNMGTPGDIANISANGMRTNSNNLQLDGVATVDTGNNGMMFAVTLDSIAEFKVLTSNYQAEYGRAA
ncbi:MAG TPA: carboxypeptidase-like regulatory domain-containing protein, partial [Blastocatellia bacterium]|nr:carboxypeptidase-like regulatory domain-containing protein [Blastocatellia bacterium]